MSVSDTKSFTAEQVYGIECEQPAELVQGEIVEMVRPGARHGIVCAEVAFLLKQWNKSAQLGRITANDSGVITERDPDSVRGPDLYFIRSGRLPGGKVPEGWLEIPPDLCIEVLLAHDRWNDVLAKVNEYLSLGVEEVWVIDPQLQNVHLFRQDAAPRIVGADAELTSPLLPGFACRVSDFFVEC